MAERRMFAKTIIDSDAFLDMPLSAQALYFHLSMRADDEGFVGNPKRIRGMVGASEDDFKLLIVKKFLLLFESGVVVIKHWKIHNYIQSDRAKDTVYSEEKRTLSIDSRKAYVSKSDMECIQTEYDLDTSVDLELEESKPAHACGQSYEEIMYDLAVEEEIKPMLWEFIKHCQANGHKLINSKLSDIIIRLDFAYKSDYKAKIKSLKAAISGGYYDVKEGKGV